MLTTRTDLFGNSRLEINVNVHNCMQCIVACRYASFCKLTHNMCSVQY